MKDYTRAAGKVFLFCMCIVFIYAIIKYTHTPSTTQAPTPYVPGIINTVVGKDGDTMSLPCSPSNMFSFSAFYTSPSITYPTYDVTDQMSSYLSSSNYTSFVFNAKDTLGMLEGGMLMMKYICSVSPSATVLGIAMPDIGIAIGVAPEGVVVPTLYWEQKGHDIQALYVLQFANEMAQSIPLTVTKVNFSAPQLIFYLTAPYTGQVSLLRSDNNGETYYTVNTQSITNASFILYTVGQTGN